MIRPSIRPAQPLCFCARHSNIVERACAVRNMYAFAPCTAVATAKPRLNAVLESALTTEEREYFLIP